MAWLAINKSGREFIFDYHPIDIRYINNGILMQDWGCDEDSYVIELPKGTIKKILGYELTWEDEPVEIKED